MAIRTLYKQKDLPLTLAIDMYHQVFRPSINDKSFYETLRYRRPAHECIENWSILRNNLVFTKGYVSLFSNATIAVWVAYESLLLTLEDADDDFITDDVQVFIYANSKFYVKAEADQVVFLLPEEY